MPRSRNPYTGGVTQRHPRPQGWLSRTHKKGRPWFRRARLSFLRWRRFIMSNPQTAFVYRWLVGCVGGTVIVIGLILVPLPGPGWLIVFVGLAIIASEFQWAQNLLLWGRAVLHRWTEWLRASHWSVSLAVATLTGAFVAGVMWLGLLMTGLPDWVPDWPVFHWLLLR